MSPQKFVLIERFGNVRDQFQPEKLERRGQKVLENIDFLWEHEETRAHANIYHLRKHNHVILYSCMSHETLDRFIYIYRPLTTSSYHQQQEAIQELETTKIKSLSFRKQKWLW